MNSSQQRNALIAGLVLLCGLGVCFLISQIKPERNKVPVNSVENGESVERPAPTLSFKGMNVKEDPNFPINDKMELPFMGKVQCHARQEKVQFKANGTQKEWPFKLYYLPSGMFVRAEFVCPGRKDYEFSRSDVEDIYRSTAESLVGFPEKAAPASLGKVLQSLYESEPFDTASKINITWVLREHDGTISPCFIANIWGVSSGFMFGRVPEDDEGFLKTRILLSPEGEAVISDNSL